MAERKLRADAQRNLEKVKSAAIEVFQERGLDAPMEAIAQRAGVRAGTIYHRFGTREALIEAVVPDVALARLGAALERARAETDPWTRFVVYLTEICAMQAADPSLNDLVVRRFPEAAHLTAICDKALELAGGFIEQAQQAGALREDFTVADMFVLFWTNGKLARQAPGAWRRALGFTVDGLRRSAAHPLPDGQADVWAALAGR